jgi:hypothetical protein
MLRHPLDLFCQQKSQALRINDAGPLHGQCPYNRRPITQLVHFAPVFWKSRALSAPEAQGDTFSLWFNGSARQGPSGLILSISLMSLMLSHTRIFRANMPVGR